MTHTARLTLAAYAMTILAPMTAVAQEAGVPYEQDFVLTAYYSPLPDQCCYVKGSFEADKILNGNGTHGADGTPVYPGMLAAPKSYPFGTRIELPGLGIMTVHDRGGAIQEWDDSHRLDVWAGAGEEGLARALEFGVKRIRGTVYPKGSPAPAENISLEKLPAPEAKLKSYVVAEAGLSDLSPAHGNRGLSVTMLQEQLKALGYFNHEITGLFGDVTKQSLAAFIADMKLSETSDELTEKTGAYLEAAVRVKDAQSKAVFVDAASSPSDIMKAQRTLRSLRYYRGRTDGKYSQGVISAIIAYQRDNGLIAGADSPGAGRIGPMTKAKIDNDVKRNRIARIAKEIIAKNEVRDLLAEKEMIIDATMDIGKSGDSVRMLQTLLAKKGFFPANMINGNYGPLTADAVAEYQVARKVLGTKTEKGSGSVGPITLKTIRQEQVAEMYRIVRQMGWSAI
jgi:peptidoglycan hydrolase-like protein with peptidoglycan-binding domain/3D (Asp-Asp-Asp) domain-containing protein